MPIDVLSKIIRCPLVTPRVYKNGVHHRKGISLPRTQAQLNNLRKWAVPPGGILNPQGQRGHARYQPTEVKSIREAGMRRNRVKLEIKKAIALEAHELQALARKNATLAMQTLIEISKNKRAPEATRIAASAVILDRGYGKASQTSITANVTNGKTKEINSTELDTRIRSALQRVEDLTNRAPKAGTSQKRPTDIRKYN